MPTSEAISWAPVPSREPPVAGAAVAEKFQRQGAFVRCAGEQSLSGVRNCHSRAGPKTGFWIISALLLTDAPSRATRRTSSGAASNSNSMGNFHLRSPRLGDGGPVLGLSSRTVPASTAFRLAGNGVSLASGPSCKPECKHDLILVTAGQIGYSLRSAKLIADCWRADRRRWVLR